MSEELGRLRRFVRDLTGGVDDELLDALRDQLRMAAEAVGVMREVLGRGEGADLHDVAQRVDDLESRGDDARSRLVSALSRTLTTPIDREDLFRVSRSFDDVLDNLRDFARELALYRPHLDEDRYGGLLDDVDRGVAALEAAVGALEGGGATLLARAKDAKSAGGDIRRGYHRQVARLLSGELTMDTLKHRELLRRLDVVGLRLGEAGDALEDGALKRGS